MYICTIDYKAKGTFATLLDTTGDKERLVTAAISAFAGVEWISETWY